MHTTRRERIQEQVNKNRIDLLEQRLTELEHQHAPRTALLHNQQILNARIQQLANQLRTYADTLDPPT